MLNAKDASNDKGGLLAANPLAGSRRQPTEAEEERVVLEKPGHKPRQAFKDNLILGPIDKYVKYNIFPYKFLIHIMLMFLTAWQIIMQIAPQTTYEAQFNLILNQIFLTTDPESFQPPEIGATVSLYDIPELRAYVINTIDSYYNIDDESNN